MRIGFVGLGQMGRHMAFNLNGAGTTLLAYDSSPDARRMAEERGLKTALTLREALEFGDIVFFSLPTLDILFSELWGTENTASILTAGKLLIDLGTSSWEQTLEMGKRLATIGVDFADAPVSGMEQRAKDATLTVMFGGREGLLHKARPLLETISDNIVNMGDLGNGQLAKLINQLLFDVNVTAMAEILAFAAALGLDARKTGSVVNSGTGRSFASEFFIPHILDGEFHHGYSLQNAYKDLIHASEISSRKSIPMPVLQSATAVYQTALREGYGAEDKGAIIKVYERLTGKVFRA